MHYISLQKWWAKVFDKLLKLYLIRMLTNWLPEVDCKNVLSITCHEKDSELFNTLKCLIGKSTAEIHWLR